MPKTEAYRNDFRDKQQGMSIEEKMGRWRSKAGETAIGNEKAELSDEEMDDAQDDDGELDSFTKEIISSSAYQWFLEALRREFSLQTSMTADTTSAAQAVRQRLVEMLPVRAVRKDRPPTVYQVVFELDSLLLRDGDGARSSIERFGKSNLIAG